MKSLWRGRGQPREVLGEEAGRVKKVGSGPTGAGGQGVQRRLFADLNGSARTAAAGEGAPGSADHPPHADAIVIASVSVNARKNVENENGSRNWQVCY